MFERSQSSFVVCGKFWGGRREKVKVSPDTALGQEGNRARGVVVWETGLGGQETLFACLGRRFNTRMSRSREAFTTDYGRDGEKGQQQPALVSLPRPSQQ